MDTLSLTKEARIYNLYRLYKKRQSLWIVKEKTTSLTSGAGKTGQPLVKE